MPVKLESEKCMIVVGVSLDRDSSEAFDDNER